MEKTNQKHIISQSVVFHRHHKTSLLKRIQTCSYLQKSHISNQKQSLTMTLTDSVYPQTASSTSSHSCSALLMATWLYLTISRHLGGHTALLCHAGLTGLVCLCLLCALVSQYSEVFPVPDQPEGSLSFHHTSFGCTEICRWILLACVLNKSVKVPFCPWYHERERKLN